MLPWQRIFGQNWL